MRYIFIPIHQGLHLTCVLLSTWNRRRLSITNSMHYDNVTRHGCRHKIKMQENTLQVLRDYLQNEHMKDKHKDLQMETKYYVQGPTTR